MKFEENLRELRKGKGLSQEELADQLEVSRQAVSKWENGSGYPELDKLMKLCEIFGCTMDELLKGNVGEQSGVSKKNYEDHCNLMSKVTTFGVFMIMCALVAGAYIEPYFTGEREVMIGIVFFVFITIGVLVLVYYGMQKEAFDKKYPEKPVRIYTQDEFDEFNRRYRLSVVIGIGIILLSFAVQQVLEYTVVENIASGTWMLMIALAVADFVYFGMLKSKYDETEEKSEEKRRTEEKDALIGKWCGCIMIVCTAIFLLWSFLFDAWKISWLIFVMGGLACGIVGIVLSKEK